MNIKEYLCNTIELTQGEVDNFDSLFELKSLKIDSEKSLIFFYSKNSPDTDFNIFVCHSNSKEYNNRLETINLMDLSEHLAQMQKDIVVQANSILALNPGIFKKIRQTTDLLVERAQNKKLFDDDKKFDLLIRTLNLRLEKRIKESLVDVGSIGVITKELNEEIKFIASTLPHSELGYTVMVGRVYQETSKNSSFPSYQKVIDYTKYKTDTKNQSLSIPEIHPRKKYSILSIIPKSNPDKAILLYKEIGDYKSFAELSLRMQIFNNDNSSPSSLLDNTMNEVCEQYFKHFIQIDNKANVNNLFALHELPLLEKYLLEKQSILYAEMKEICEWMRINCEKYQLSNSLSSPTISLTQTKETLKV